MKLKTRIKISMVGIMAAMVAIYTAIILGSTIQTYRRDMEDSLRSVGEQKLMTMDSLMNTMVTITEKPLFDNTILSILRKSAEDYRQAHRVVEMADGNGRLWATGIGAWSSIDYGSSDMDSNFYAGLIGAEVDVADSTKIGVFFGAGTTENKAGSFKAESNDIHGGSMV